MRRVRPAVFLASWLLLSDWPLGEPTALALSSIPRKQSAAENRTAESSLLLSFQGQLSPLEENLLADAADGRLDEHSLLQAALVASGTETPEGLRRYQQRQSELVAELRRSGPLGDTPRRQAHAIFEFMHRRILRGGYRLESTDLRLAFDEGRFNCVSASVLFGCLCEEFSLASRGLEMPGHAMTRLVLPDGPLDVETTCPLWFRLIGDPKKQAEAVAKMLGPSHGGDRAELREISAVQMIAMIYYNRGIDLLAEKRFAAAAAANAKALRLDPANTTARGNLLATINNWAIAVGGAQHYAESAGLLRQGLTLAPAYETFSLNYVHVHHEWVEQLCRTGQFQEALEVLARAAAELPDRTYFRHAAAEVYRRWDEAVGSRR